MIGTLFRDLSTKYGLTTSSGLAYGLLNGCFITLSEEAGVQRISIYVGPQEQPAPGYAESQTVSCAKQICHTISSASGQENIYALMTDNEAIPALVLNHAGSVVTVNFPAAPESRAGIERFIAELLPMIAPLTRPHMCIYCCQPTQGDACPVRLSADTVAPMHLPCYQQAAGLHAPSQQERSAQSKAVFGAAAGALLGAIIWALLSGSGPVAWVSAVLMGLLPTLAYDYLKGRAGQSRIVTILVCAGVAVLLGSLGACLIDLHGEYLRNLTVMTAKDVSFFAYLPAGLTKGAGILASLLRTLIAGLVFAAIGCIGCFRKSAEATAHASRPRRLRGQF